MPDTAQTQVTRLVHLIAWMSQRDSGTPISYAKAAQHLGVAERTIREDLDTLVSVSDDYKPWLASLHVAFTAGGFVVESRGPFRRPFRLTADETLALVLGLAGSPRGKKLAATLGAALHTSPKAARTTTAIALGPAPSAHVDEVLALARQAVDHRRKLEIEYCGSAGEPGRRVTHPHQVVQRGTRWYLVAWCEAVAAVRHFRADRVLAARLLESSFTPAPSFQPVTRPEQVFQADETVTATVVFSARIARWLKERYPGGREQTDGRYLVTFRVADPAWFVREVTQYGAEAEVTDPASLREAVRRMVE